jgi:hypothetical protein
LVCDKLIFGRQCLVRNSVVLIAFGPLIRSVTGFVMAKMANIAFNTSCTRAFLPLAPDGQLSAALLGTYGFWKEGRGRKVVPRRTSYAVYPNMYAVSPPTYLNDANARLACKPVVAQLRYVERLAHRAPTINTCCTSSAVSMMGFEASGILLTMIDFAPLLRCPCCDR